MFRSDEFLARDATRGETPWNVVRRLAAVTSFIEIPCSRARCTRIIIDRPNLETVRYYFRRHGVGEKFPRDDAVSLVTRMISHSRDRGNVAYVSRNTHHNPAFRRRVHVFTTEVHAHDYKSCF